MASITSGRKAAAFYPGGGWLGRPSGSRPAPSRFPRDFFCQCNQGTALTIYVTVTDSTTPMWGEIGASSDDTLLLRAIYAPAEEGEYERVEVPSVFQKAFKDEDLSV